MLQIKYNDIFLDIAANQSAEMERKSPLFSLEEYMAEYSTPIKFLNTEKNAKALEFFFFEPSFRRKKKVDVEVYDHHGYRFPAKLVLESAGFNSSQAGAQFASGYLLTGISDFLTLIKGKKLSELSLGGDRPFTFTTFDPADGSGGYWQHVHDTWDGSYDYVTVLVSDDNFYGQLDNDFNNGLFNFINQINADGNLQYPESVVAFPFIEYILNQIFLEHGWTVDTTGINDEDWKKMVLHNVRPIAPLVDLISYLPGNTIYISLNKYMPEGKTCVDFLNAMFSRYGWVPLPDANKKHCRIVSLKESGNGTLKDWTKYAATYSEALLSDEVKKASFKNTFEGNDQLPSGLNTDGFFIDTPVASKYDLPAPAAAFDNKLILAFLENQYYKIALDDDNNRMWVPYADNIYDEVIDDSTVSYGTVNAPLPNYWKAYRTKDDITYYALMPACSQSQYEKWGFRTFFYHGLQLERKDDGTDGLKNYPFGSSVCALPDGTNGTAWSNVYRHIFNSVDYGIIEYWFKRWLEITNNPEEITRRFYLPFHELVNFQWDDILLVNNITYLVKSFTEPLPYGGFIEAKLTRLLLSKQPGGTLGVFVKIVFENVLEDQTNVYTNPLTGEVSTYTNLKTAVIKIAVFSDSEGTKPLVVSNLKILQRQTTFKDSVFNNQVDTNQTLNGVSSSTWLGFPIITTLYVEYDYTSSTIPASNGHYLNEFEILPSDDYEIIP